MKSCLKLPSSHLLTHRKDSSSVISSASLLDKDVFADGAEMLCQPCQPVLHCLRKLIRSHGHYENKSCMIPEYIISPLWNIFTNDEMLLLSASDIQSLSVSLMTALVTQKDLGQLQGENFQHKVRGTKFLSYLLLNHFFCHFITNHKAARLPPVVQWEQYNGSFICQDPEPSHLKKYITSYLSLLWRLDSSPDILAPFLIHKIPWKEVLCIKTLLDFRPRNIFSSLVFTLKILINNEVKFHLQK